MVGVPIHFISSSSLLKTNGYTEKDEAEIYDALLQDVYDNPRWYLDNLDYLKEFRVRWIDYKTVKVTKPYKFVSKIVEIPKAL